MEPLERCSTSSGTRADHTTSVTEHLVIPSSLTNDVIQSAGKMESPERCCPVFRRKTKRGSAMTNDVTMNRNKTSIVTASLITEGQFMPPDIYKPATGGNVGYFEKRKEDLENHDSWENSKTPRGDTVLHIAARSGQDELVRMMLRSHRALAYLENSTGNFPVHEASGAGHQSIVEILLLQNTEPLQLRAKNRGDNTPLHLALRNRHESVARYLFEQENGVTHHLNRQGKSPLHMAAEAGYAELFKLMMNKPHPPEWREKYMPSVVHAAITAKHTDVLKILLTECKGEVFRSFNEEGMRPLSYVSFIGYADAVDELLKKDCKYSYLADKNGFYPIHMAAIGGHVSILQKFLGKCPDSRELFNNKGQNILHLAAKSGQAKTVSYMLKNPELEMLINERDFEGNTPLHLATKWSHPKVVSILTWDSRVMLDCTNNEGMTALDVAGEYTGILPTYRESLTWQALRHARAPRADDSLNSISSNKKVTPDLNLFKDRTNTLMLVATLIVTITFAAGFIVPAGHNDSKFRRAIFHLFVIGNVVAMYTSLTVVVALIWSQLGDIWLLLASLRYTQVVLGTSLAGVAIAFMTGVYLVVDTHEKLAISVLVLGSIGFLALFLLFAPLNIPSSLNHRYTRYIFYIPFCLLIKVTHCDHPMTNGEVKAKILGEEK